LPFDSIALSEMDQVALLNRVDTKYVMRVSQLEYVLSELADQYRVLRIGPTALNRYQTLYFDTPDFALYRQHHNGLRARYKVRVREYVDSHLAYWEVKRRTNQERTVKLRLRAPDRLMQDHEQIAEFIGEHLTDDVHDLEPKLWNRFQRVTLVSKRYPERLTLDVNVEFGWTEKPFEKCIGGRNLPEPTVTNPRLLPSPLWGRAGEGGSQMASGLPGIAIAEVKRERASQPSDFVQHMRWLGIRPCRFSKYCAGVYMLYDTVKANNFTARMRLVEKLMQEELIYDYLR
jgi:hypothetical protein